MVPDLAVYSKAIGGGLPIAAFAGRRDVMDLIGSNVVKHGGTYNANPLCATAALHTLTQLNRAEVRDRLRTAGEAVMEAIRRGAADHGVGVVLKRRRVDVPGDLHRRPDADAKLPRPGPGRRRPVRRLPPRAAAARRPRQQLGPGLLVPPVPPTRPTTRPWPRPPSTGRCGPSREVRVGQAFLPVTAGRTRPAVPGCSPRRGDGVPSPVTGRNAGPTARIHAHPPHRRRLRTGPRSRSCEPSTGTRRPPSPAGPGCTGSGRWCGTRPSGRRSTARRSPTTASTRGGSARRPTWAASSPRPRT